MKKRYFVFLLVILILTSSCSIQDNNKSATTPKAETGQSQTLYKEIAAVIADQENAVQTKDESRYMKTIYKDNDTYYNESRYLSYMLNYAAISDFGMELLEVTAESEDKAIATIHQSYEMNGTVNEVTYTERFLKTGGRWLDNDVAFEQGDLGHVKIFYMANIPDLQRFMDSIGKSLKNVEETFPDPLTGSVEIKLYSDRELLRQKTDLGIAWLFTGWAEENHAIKAFTGRESEYNYESLFTHELIHKLTISESNGNMPIWFAEGLAIHYGTYFVNGETYVEQGKITFDDIKMTLSQLQSIPLEKLTVESEILSYYGTAGMYVNYLAETYGDEAVFSLYQSLGDYPVNDIAADPEWVEHADERLLAVINKELGQDLSQISEEYLKWIEDLEASQ